MKAMVLAAGLGTRLRPLTNDRPKALVEVGGRTLLDITLSSLRSFGVTEVIVNAHHFADMIVAYLRSHDNFGMSVEVSREPVLLDTGGGLKNAAWFFLNDRAGQPFILHNVDVLSTIDLRRMMSCHLERDALVTLAVQERPTSRALLFDDNLQLCGRRTAQDQPPEIARPSQNLKALGFCGIHVISPRMLAMMREEGVFSIIGTYLHLAAQGENIVGFRADEYYWQDLGTPDHIRQAAQHVQQNLTP